MVGAAVQGHAAVAVVGYSPSLHNHVVAVEAVVFSDCSRWFPLLLRF